MKQISVFNENPFWLQDAHYTCQTMYCSVTDANVITDSLGRKILPSGTIWPSNSAGTEAVGIVLRDVEIPFGEPGALFSCLTHGRINKHYLPVAVEATLPTTIVFADTTPGHGDSLGYNIIECTPATLSSGSIPKGTSFTVTLSLSAVGGAGYAFKSGAQPGDFRIGNAHYPLAIQSVSGSGSSVDLTVYVNKDFVAVPGVAIAITAKGSALVYDGSPAPFDSNTVIGLRV